MSHVLAVDDDPAILRALERLLRREGHETTTAGSGEEALATIATERPDIILLDVEMGGIDGLETLARLGVQAPGVPVVIMTAKSDVDTAVRAFKRGAVDFVAKPFIEAKLLGALRFAATGRRGTGGDGGPVLVGESARFRAVMDLANRLAKPEINILLEGETGTGKELFARAIHAASARSEAPFIAVDCSMLAENLIESELFGHERGAFTGAVAARIGHFERANGGTLFLDEVGNLSLHVQAKLLRAIQERTIERVGGRETRKLDVRLVAAANVDLREAAHRGVFRSDLYYRLAEATICPPPLRERRGDVGLLAKHFVAQYAARFGVAISGIAPDALACLEAHDWPGNVRELEAVIKVAVALAQDVVRVEQLPKWIVRADTAAPGWLEARSEAPKQQNADVGGRVGGAPQTPASGDRVGGAPQTPASGGRVGGAPQTPASGGRVGGDPQTPASGDRLRVEIDLDLQGESFDLKALTSAASEQAERAILEAMLRRGHSQARLAKLLNVDPKTLRGKLRRHGLDAGSE